jgi:hypothetical protein
MIFFKDKPLQQYIKKHTLFFAALFIIVPFLYLGCSDENCSTCSGPESCDYPPGNRSFTWRMDTVAWWPSTLGGIHAFADDDVYLMGYIGEGKAPWRTFMAKHWNGIEWNNETNGSYEEIKHFAIDVTGDDHFMVSVGYYSIGSEMAALAEFDNHSKKWNAFQFEIEGALTSVWTDGKGFFIAVGWNGMVFTKDGYDAEWIYSKAPTDFHFTRVVGINKNELYMRAGISLVNGENFQQYWKVMNGQWTKLFDGQDSTGTPVKLYNTDNAMYDVGAWRCPVSDSIKLYLIGWESFLLESAGQSLDFKITNLSDRGLPLRSLGRTGWDINLFTPNDIWIFGSRYNFYHWNGTDFVKMILPGLPDNDTQFGNQQKMIKTSSGKVFLPTEISSQVYVVMQGTP